MKIKLHPHFPPYKNILLVYCWLEVVKACDKMCQDSGFWSQLLTIFGDIGNQYIHCLLVQYTEPCLYHHEHHSLFFLSVYLKVPFGRPFSWIFWWMGELGTELNLEIFVAILFSIMIDLMVIFLLGLLYRSSHGSHCRNTRLIWSKSYVVDINRLNGICAMCLLSVT